MASNHVLAVAVAVAFMMIVLMVLGQAIGQFDNVLKTVLRPKKAGSERQPVKVWVLAPAAVVVAIGILSLLIAFLAG
jgi:hypothetical protein